MTKPAFDFRRHMRRPADLESWLVRGRKPTLRDDLRDLWADIAANPTSHALVGFAGTVLGLAVTLGPAIVWSWFL